MESNTQKAIDYSHEHIQEFINSLIEFLKIQTLSSIKPIKVKFAKARNGWQPI